MSYKVKPFRELIIRNVEVDTYYKITIIGTSAAEEEPKVGNVRIAITNKQIYKEIGTFIGTLQTAIIFIFVDTSGSLTLTSVDGLRFTADVEKHVIV